MDIKPIRSEADYEAALKEIETLVNSQPGTPEGDRMDVLVTLVQAYEASHYPIPEPDDPVGVLEYYMESRGLSRSDLLPYLGSKERVSEILNRKRGLSLGNDPAAARRVWGFPPIYWWGNMKHRADGIRQHLQA